MHPDTQVAIYHSLETLSQAEQYYKWLASRMRPFLTGKVLEVGAGIGTFAKAARESVSEYHVSDGDPMMVEQLRKHFAQAYVWNIYEPFPTTDQYDTVVMINVLEHLDRDLDAIRALSERIKPGGHLILIVPAMRFLFGSLDTSFGHYRRYQKPVMKTLIDQASLRLLKNEYINVVGMFGWFLYGRMLKRDHLPPALTNRFNLVVPLLSIEKPVAYFAGLSLLSIAAK